MTSKNIYQVFLSKHPSMYANYYCEFNYDEHDWINGSSGTVSFALKEQGYVFLMHTKGPFIFMYYKMYTPTSISK